MPSVTSYGTNAHATPVAANIFPCELPHIQNDVAGALPQGQSGDASCWSAGMSKVPASKHSKGEQGIIQIPLAQHLATVVIASSSTPTHAASADCTAEQ
jgi:hypothetical protein